eukprot:CAMPEP_0197650448 /NCGR_PEP_ID=MMETSP1338-20131121/30950_1 /TAXON_ID=43686 ORGANISM="Pelagodinium beii, Strain RCC1491" /NCGR_SAMPLE_ID=MMETSP1338 /ASSEMBLY_ACC=CAM_ASM_000754 /LENGTH=375 /DNA_ID=CAMNT_0043224857 /DNA_START=49 /DNA_END=1176 /DNA_ORIENTATION=+
MSATKAPVTGKVQDEVDKHTEKMLKLKLSQLKKLAKKNGVPDEVVDTAVGEDEEGTKSMLVSLIFKAACAKAARPPASPQRKREQPVMHEDDLCCSLCAGCIRIPFHEGPCMDGQCNEIYPEPEVVAPAEEPHWAEEMARHKAMTEEVQRKLKAQEDQAAEKARQKAAEEALRQKAAKEEEEAMRQKAAEEEARKRAAEEAQKKLAQEEEARKKAEEAQKLAEEVQKRAAEFARQKEEEEELAQQKLAEEDEARLRAKAMQQKLAEEEEAAMDAQCIDAFLRCTMSRVKTPLKGTNLYTKHIRPARLEGTSVDVKDSSFRTLGNFLQFLEGEKLLCLQPGLSDPVVTKIRYEACQNYEYIPGPRPVPGSAALKFQ